MTSTPASMPRLSEAARHLIYPSNIVESAFPRVERRLTSVDYLFDPWQQGFGTIALGLDESDTFAATVGGVVASIPRQCGKTYTVGGLLDRALGTDVDGDEGAGCGEDVGQVAQLHGDLRGVEGWRRSGRSPASYPRPRGTYAPCARRIGHSPGGPVTGSTGPGVRCWQSHQEPPGQRAQQRPDWKQLPGPLLCFYCLLKVFEMTSAQR